MSTWPINDAASKVFPLYSRANVGEIFPGPITPLNASAGFLANLEPGWRDAFVACGVWEHDLYDETVEHNPIACFGGYLFLNMSLMRLFGVRVPGFTPEAVDLQYFGDMPGIPSYESERRDFDESEEHAAKAGAWLVNEVLGATDLAAYEHDRATVLEIRRDRPDLASLDDAALRRRLVQFADVMRLLYQHHIEASLKAGVGLGAVASVCAELGQPERALTLVAGLGDVDSVGPSEHMWALSRDVRSSAEVTALFDAGLDGLWDRIQAGTDGSVAPFAERLRVFLQDWDFRGPSEWEIRAETWGTQPALALQLIDRLRLVDDSDAPAAKNAQRATERESGTTALRSLLADNPEALAQVDAALHAAALWLRGRERQRTTCAMLVHEQRLAALELGRRGALAGALDDPHQIFMLFDDELDAYLADPATFTEIVRERETDYLALDDFVPPFVTEGAPAPVTSWARRGDDVAAPLVAGDVATGVPACPGIVTGRARVVLTPDDAGDLSPGEILVAPITDPSWTPLVVAAAAVVVDVGAPFSHAAIVSRELGIPCVVSVTDATKKIPDGAMVTVDGAAGTVTVH